MVPNDFIVWKTVLLGDQREMLALLYNVSFRHGRKPQTTFLLRLLRTRSRTRTQLLFAPRLFVQVRKRDFAISLIDSIHAGAAIRVQEPFRFGAVRSGDAILYVRLGFALLINEGDFNPKTGCQSERTRRKSEGLSTRARLN